MVLVAGIGCGSTLIDEHARPEMLLLSCSADRIACNGSCLACSPPAHASAACVPVGCGFTCDPGYNQCGPSSCVAESATSCGPSCEDCSGRVPANASAICNGAHACDFECQPGFLRSGGECRRAVAVSGGFEHTCALTTDGRVKCWGSNEFGQLGDGTLYSTPVPVDPALPGPAQSISAGYYHTCAAVAGQVYCWGNGTLGELGNGTTKSSMTPVLAVGLSGVDKVTAGGDGDPGFVNAFAHTCALVSGKPWCWGSNGSGQLGDHTTITRGTPAPTTILPAGVVVTSLALGERHTCALTDQGAVYCWGANDSGQLGIPGALPQTYPAQPTIAHGATSISAGEGHSCAVVDRTLYCWGLNDSYQVDPVLAPAAYETAVEPPTSGVRPTQVTAGKFHTCVLDATALDEDVYCFGSNPADQLGSPDVTVRGSGIALLAPGPALAISSGSQHTCVLTAEGGVQCWGENEYGQLGVETGGAASAIPGYVSGR